jgi:hypothetical protein
MRLRNPKKEKFTMATVKKHVAKTGVVTYYIRTYDGYDSKGKQIERSMTWKPTEGMTPKQIEKELTRQAVLFEEECKRGQITSAVKFEKFAEQWFEEYAKVNLRPTSYARMRQLTKRVYPAIGHKRLDKITARDVQKFVTDMLVNGKNMNTGKPLAFHECGKVPAVEKFEKDEDLWAWFMIWHTDHLMKNDKETLKAVYNSEKVITLDELPALYTVNASEEGEDDED